MAGGSILNALLLLLGLLIGSVLPHVNAQEIAAPAPSPISDGTAIDQGIAYILMLVALLLTYFIH